MDWVQYWFLFPLAMAVATTAMLSGIGGAAMFTPIFLVVLPLLGPDYPFGSFAAAIGVAVLTQTFGFTSGFIGYYRKRLIDYSSAWPFIAAGVPLAIAGGLLLARSKPYENALFAAYAVLMFVLSVALFRRRAVVPVTGPSPTAFAANAKSITDHRGRTYSYTAPRIGDGVALTGLGGFLTGLLGVGIGEVVLPQLVTKHRVPFPVAAATSVFVTIVVVATASATQVAGLVSAGGIDALPWNAVVYLVPGVLIGGQLGPALQGRVPARVMELAIASLFAAIGSAITWIALRSIF